MQVVRKLSEFAQVLGEVSSRPVAVAIGNFDGCHLGHQALLHQLDNLQKTRDFLPVVATFYPHPGAYFSKLEKPHIFTTELKLAAFQEQGIAITFIQSFDHDFSLLSADDYFKKVLIAGLKARAIIVGNDFKFGRDRIGNIEYLRELCNLTGTELFPISIQKYNEHEIRSTYIRDLISNGQMSEVCRLLARPFLLPGQSIQGQKIGRSLGVPTINLSPQKGIIIPKAGVYAGYISINHTGFAHTSIQVFPDLNDLMPAAINIGNRPSINNGKNLSIEAHVLIDRSSDRELAFVKEEQYGKNFGFYFADYIRPEEKFPSLTALKEQILQDIDSCRSRLNFK